VISPMVLVQQRPPRRVCEIVYPSFGT
jgi:hypothetical protein